MLTNFTMWSSNLFFSIQLFPAFFTVHVFQSLDFSGSTFFWVQVFQSPGPGSKSWAWVKVLEIPILQDLQEIIIYKTIKNFTAINKGCFKRGCNSPFQKQPPKVSCKKAAFKNFAIFAGKHLCWSLFLISLQGQNPSTSLKRDSSAGLFL